MINIISLTLAKTLIGDEALLAFAKTSRPLIHIDLSMCPNISDIGIKPLIQRSRNLLVLKLNESNIGDIDLLLYAMEHCQEIKHIEAKNIDLQQKGKNTSIHRIVDCLCTCAPRLESIDIDLFENPSNKMLLMSKMKTVMNQIRNNYTNVAFNLPFENITQSSYNVDKSRNGSLAVDGKMSSRFGEAWCDHSATTTMTGVDIEAFLELDLQRVHNVREVFVKAFVVVLI